MELRGKVVVGVWLSLVILLAAVASTGCGGSSAGTATTNSGSVTSSLAPTSAGERQAAEAYFAVMGPVIDKDYQSLQRMNLAVAQWQSTYASTDPSTNRQAWNALGLVLEQALVDQQENVRGYEAVVPPEAFRAAHEALVSCIRDGDSWAEDLAAAIKANRPMSELTSMFTAGPPGPSGSEVLAEFQEAAVHVGIELPAKLIDTYSDEIESSTNG
jgi:hypothetical protein